MGGVFYGLCFFGCCLRSVQGLLTNFQMCVNLITQLFAVSGKVGIQSTRFTTPVRWLSLFQCNRSFLVVFCVFALLFGVFCECKGFCRRTESDIFLFLSVKDSPWIQAGHQSWVCDYNTSSFQVAYNKFWTLLQMQHLPRVDRGLAHFCLFLKSWLVVV